jgi:DNA helicase-2/ATP-dependent DNA helicase PcrA
MKDSSRLLEELNPRQREAVTWPSGPVLVLAGAGSGKTRVLAHRIAYLMGPGGIPPHNILAVTFTNKAAGEMAERVRKLLGGIAGPSWLGTFHSICVRILRRDGHRIGCPRDFTIYDREDSVSVVKGLVKELRLSERDFNSKGVMAKISGAKNALVSPEDYPCPDTYTRQLVRLFSMYNHRLRKYRALDFDDLLIRVVELLSQDGQASEKYRDHFQHILVDEYQDTNRAQYLIIRHLSGTEGNVFVVGDDDQSIYGFRGADLNNILDFEEDFTNVKTIRLEQNYRSTKLILEAASSVVRNNVGRMGKELWTENSRGAKLVLLEALDEVDEAALVCESLFRSGRNLRDSVILYRTNAQSRSFEETLRRKGLPYVVVGGVRFYERKEIKDLLAYMRVIVNANDAVSLRRIVNVPPRGIGAAVLKRLDDFAARSGEDLYSAILRAEEVDGLRARSLSGLKEFRVIVEKGRAVAREVGAAELLSQIIQDTRYVDELQAERTKEAESRVENVRELLASAEAYEQRAVDRTARGFLAEVSLYTDIDGWNDKQDVVSLMTAHNAKGLEFPVVYITGLEDGLFPHSNSFDSPSGLEEERRLFYVSLTRAKEEAYLSFASQRRRYGGSIPSFPSRFIREIPESLFEVQTSSSRALDAGAIVRHPDWGLARVLRVEGDGEEAKALLRFEAGFDKLVMLKYAGLVRVSKEELWE